MGEGLGESGVEVGGAVAVGSQGESGGGVGAVFCGEQEAVLVVLGEVGGEDFEDLAAQPGQLTGAEVAGLGEQVGLGLGQQLGSPTGSRAGRREPG